MNVLDVIRMTAEANSPEELQKQLMSKAEGMSEEEIKEFVSKVQNLSTDELAQLVLETMQKEYFE